MEKKLKGKTIIKKIIKAHNTHSPIYQYLIKKKKKDDIKNMKIRNILIFWSS